MTTININEEPLEAPDGPRMTRGLTKLAATAPLGDDFEPLGSAQDSFEPLGPPSEDDELQTIFDAAKAQPPGYADALSVAQKAGVPVTVVRENIDAFRAKIEASGFNARRFKEQNPELARLMLNKPQIAPAVAQDGAFAKLETLLKGVGSWAIGRHIWGDDGLFKGITSVPSGVARAWQGGRLQVELSRIAERQYGGTATVDDLKRGDEIDKELEALGRVEEGTFGFLAGMLPAAAEQLPRYISQADQISYHVSVGLASGAAFGAGAGLLGGPAAPVTATAGGALGGIFGAGAGLAAGVGAVTAVDEGAMFYRDAIKKGATPAAARGGALIVGLANGTLEALPIDKVLRLVPGAKSLLTGPTKDIMRRLIKDPTVAGALARLAGRTGSGMAMEGVTEGLQEVSKIYELERVRGADVGSSIAEAWRQRQDVWKAARKGTQAAGGMSLASPGVWIEAGTEVAEAARAENRQDFFKALGETIGDSPTFKKLPEITKTYVKALQARYGVVKEVSLPAEALRDVLADVEVETVLPDVARQLREAGPETEVVISTADLAAHVAPLSGFEKLTPDIRVGDSPTAREAAEVKEQAQKIKEEESTKDGPADPKTDPERYVFEGVRLRLIELGQTPEVASHNAALWQAFVASMARRAGKDPITYFKDLNVSFGAGEFEALTKKEQKRALTQSDYVIWRPSEGPAPVPLEDTKVAPAPPTTPEKPSAVGPSSPLNKTARELYPELWAKEPEQIDLTDVETLLQSEGAKVEAAFRLPDGRIVKTGQFHDIGALPEGLKVEDATDADEPGKLVSGFAVGDRFWAKEQIAQLRQKNGGTVRGFFETNAARDFFKITLTGKANLSTFIHESGHAFLAILERDARTNAQAAADLQVVREWLGAKGAKTWTKDQLETFARGFEAYLWEGKAPSTKLAEVFAAVKGWLRYIYSALTRLDVALNDEIRGVMDRMLASDMEVEQAKQVLGLTPPEDSAGLMTPEAYAKYRTAFEAATTEARERADRATLREFRRALSDEYAALKTEVEKVGKLDLTLNVRTMLETGKMLDGAEVPKAFQGQKLDREWVKQAAPELYPAVRSLTEDGGIDPDTFAVVMQYKDGLDLIQALAKTPSYAKWVKLETDRRMAEKYPGFKSTKDWATQNAHRALHTDAVGNAIWAGLQGLAQRLGGEHGTSARLAIKEAAQSRVEDMSIMELRPGVSERSEGKAAAAAAEAWRKGDAQAAYDATRRQLFHHYMWRRIDEVRGEIEDMLAYFKSFKKDSVRRKIAKGGDDFLNAIETVLGKIEFGASPERSVDLGAFLQSLREQGYPVVMPSDFTGRDYETMSVTDLRAVHASIKNLEHLAREKAKEIDEANAESMASKVKALTDSIRANLPPPPPGASTNQNPRWWEIVSNGLKNGDWHLRKIEFMVRTLDGGKTAGLAHKLLFQPMADAETAEHILYKGLLSRIKEEYRILSMTERLQHDRWVPFLDADVNGMRVTNNIRVRDLIMVMGHLRNPENEARLTTSTGWSRADILRRLGEVVSEKDVEIVNKMGRELEALWPEIERVYKAATGVPPKKVTGEGVQLTLVNGKTVMIEGGYWPIIKDRSKLPSKPQAEIDRGLGSLWDDDFIPVAVEHGFTESRGKDLASPLLLDLDALPNHMAKVIHYVTHYEATREVDRLTQRVEVKRAIVNGLGMEAYKQIRPWLMSIARDTDVGAEPLGAPSKVLRHMRVGASIVLLNAKLATGTKQLLGFTVAAKELGTTESGAHNLVLAAKYLGFGWRSFLRDLSAGNNPFAVINAIDPAFELHRENYDRDVRLAYKSALSAFSSVGAAKYHIVQMGMIMFNLFQGTVNAVTWYGAYQKALDLGHDRPADYANSVVRMSQSGGGIKDLAAVQRGSELKKMWTVMYSYRSVLWNQLREPTPQNMSTGMAIATKAAHFWYLVGLPSMLVLAMRGGQGDSPGDEDYLKKLSLEALLTTTSGIVGVDRMTEAFVNKRLPRTAPWIDAMMYSFVVGRKLAEGERVSDFEQNQIVNSIGMATHLPTGGVMNGLDFLSKYTDRRLEEPVADLLWRTPRQAR